MVLPSPQRGQERAAEAIHNNGDYTEEAPTTEPLWWNHKEPFRRYKDRISLEIGGKLAWLTVAVCTQT